MPDASPFSSESSKHYVEVLDSLKGTPKRWLVTGCAGFIGSNLIEALLKQDQEVVGIDNFVTGYRHNLEEVERLVTDEQWSRFRLIEGDIQDLNVCEDGVDKVDYVLHQAALGSVPRSISDPINSNDANVTGFLNMLDASREAKVRRFIYASSSSVYGDHEELPKCEENIGNPLSPYAVTKLVNELYAGQFAQHYAMVCYGLRYFNVFGCRQDPEGPYAAVIPKWTSAMINAEDVYIYGDGETSRDFCFISNVVQANILAATKDSPIAGQHRAFNIAVGSQTSLNQLYLALKRELSKVLPDLRIGDPRYVEFRAGDVRHSLANIERATGEIGYSPTHTIDHGLAEAIRWYINKLS